MTRKVEPLPSPANRAIDVPSLGGQEGIGGVWLGKGGCGGGGVSKNCFEFHPGEESQFPVKGPKKTRSEQTTE